MTPPADLRGLDAIGWYIAMLHQLLGHDKAAACLGQERGDKDACVICQYERHPCDEHRQAVINALQPGD